MIAQGKAAWTTGGPLLGRIHAQPKEGLMSKLKAMWEGLNNGPGGTYIRPHLDGTYEYGRWWHSWAGHWSFQKLGDAPSMSAAREAFKAVDKAVDARVRQLNKRGRRA